MLFIKSLSSLRFGALVVLSALILSGCKSVNVVERAEPLATPNVIADRRVESDPALARKVSVVQVVESSTGDLMRVQVALFNKTYDYAPFNYQFVWIEEDGMAVTSPTPIWRPGQINGRETIYVSSVAPTPRAVDFQLKLLDRESFNKIQAPARRRR